MAIFKTANWSGTEESNYRILTVFFQNCSSCYQLNELLFQQPTTCTSLTLSVFSGS